MNKSARTKILPLALIVLLVVASFGGLALSHVKANATTGSVVQTGANNNAASSSITCPLASAVTKGDTILFNIMSSVNTNVYSMSDSLSGQIYNFPTSATSITGPVFLYGFYSLGNNVRAQENYIQNTSGASDTLTFPASGGSSGTNEVVCAEIAGAYQYFPPYMVTATVSTGTGTNATVQLGSGSIYSTHSFISVELVVSACGGFSSIIPPAGFSLAVAATPTSGGTTGCAQTWQSKDALYTNPSWAGGSSQFTFTVVSNNAPSVSEAYDFIYVKGLVSTTVVTTTSVPTTTTISTVFTSTNTTTTTATLWSPTVTSTSYSPTVTSTTVTTKSTSLLTGQGSSGAVVQMEDAGGTTGTSLALTLDFPVHQYNALIDAVYIHPTASNVGSNVPTDNNTDTWVKFASCGLATGGSTNHEIDLYYANMTGTTRGITVTQTMNASTSFDFKIFSIAGINLGLISTYSQSVCNTGTTTSTSIPSTKFNTGFFVMDFSMWMQVGSSSHTWTVSDPFSTYNQNLASMVTKAPTVGSDVHYSNAAYYPKWPAGLTTTATWTPSGGSEQGAWANLAFAFPPAPVVAVTTTIGIPSSTVPNGIPFDFWVILALFGAAVSIFGIYRMATDENRADKSDVITFIIGAVVSFITAITSAFVIFTTSTGSTYTYADMAIFGYAFYALGALDIGLFIVSIVKAGQISNAVKQNVQFQ